PGIDQRGGLARSWGADEDVPRQVVEILFRAERGDARPQRWLLASEMPSAEEAHGFLEALSKLTDLPRRRVCLALCHDKTARERCVAAAGADELPAPARDGREEEYGDLDPADPLRLERAEIADRDHRTDPPDENDHDPEPDGDEHPSVEDHAGERL